MESRWLIAFKKLMTQLVGGGNNEAGRSVFHSQLPMYPAPSGMAQLEGRHLPC